MVLIKNIIRDLQKSHFYKNTTRGYIDLYKKIIKANPQLEQPAEGEEEWLRHWRKYDRHLSPLCYRIFSRYVKEGTDIIPLEFVASMVEPVLTPHKYQFYYSDKNNFNKLLPRAFMPQTFLMNIDGLMFDGEYNLLKHAEIDSYLKEMAGLHDRLVLKPSRQSSGVGVQILQKNDKGVLVNNKGKTLSLQILDEDYGANYLLQECVVQSDYMAQFNPSSINTIRIAIYRNENGEVNYMSAVLRIGAKGADVDNAHAGGVFCGVSNEGKIGNYVCDWLGRRQVKYNGLDFENNDWGIPNYDMVKEFAISVSKHLVHHDLVALDIALNKDNEPRLIELNVGGFSAWLFLMGGNSVFSGLEDSIMERCYKQYQKLEYFIWTPIHRNQYLRG